MCLSSSEEPTTWRKDEIPLSRPLAYSGIILRI
jgi:hypothetical protein